ncbi:hypothetical protein [Frankia sp. Cj5]|uniref:hypothetical protein n=1 Tax=Frankia sp. Cj5 TaxID=2880978 RepID=UPI001EF73DF1|nr:hypothetical protein [Frankia sp. Cj5]
MKPTAQAAVPADTSALFDLPDLNAVSPAVPAALPYRSHPAAAAGRALAGDGYGWLAAVLPDPTPLVCDRHGVAMVLADPPPLWVCPVCAGPAGGG